MKNILILSLILLSQVSFSQNEFKDIQIQTMNDIDISLLSALKHEKDKPLVLFTWSKNWCVQCVKILDKFDSIYYEELRKSHDLKFIALNLDKANKKKEVKEINRFVIERQWHFDVYKDPSGNYMEELNISGVPQTFLIVNNKIISYKSGFVFNDMNEETTANYINTIIKSIENK